MSTTPVERINSAPERYQRVIEAIYECVSGISTEDMDTLKVHLADLMGISKSVGYDFALTQYEFNDSVLDSAYNPFYDEEKSD